MIQNLSRLKVIDNSGAKIIEVIRCLGGSKRKASKLKDLVIASVKKALPRSNIKKGDKVLALIVATKKQFKKRTCSFISYSKNCAIVIKKEDRQPIGTSISIPIPRELEELGYKKILSLSDKEGVV